MEMFNPSHPGEIIKEMCLIPLSLSVTQAALLLGVSRKTLSELLNGKTGISAVMAIRLSMAFKSEPQFWMSLQMQYDLWKARLKTKRLKILKIAA